MSGFFRGIFNKEKAKIEELKDLSKKKSDAEVRLSITNMELNGDGFEISDFIWSIKSIIEINKSTFRLEMADGTHIDRSPLALRQLLQIDEHALFSIYDTFLEYFLEPSEYSSELTKKISSNIDVYDNEVESPLSVLVQAVNGYPPGLMQLINILSTTELNFYVICKDTRGLYEKYAHLLIGAYLDFKICLTYKALLDHSIDIEAKLIYNGHKDLKIELNGLVLIKPITFTVPFNQRLFTNSNTIERALKSTLVQAIRDNSDNFTKESLHYILNVVIDHDKLMREAVVETVNLTANKLDFVNHKGMYNIGYKLGDYIISELPANSENKLEYLSSKLSNKYIVNLFRYECLLETLGGKGIISYKIQNKLVNSDNILKILNASINNHAISRNIGRRIDNHLNRKLIDWLNCQVHDYLLTHRQRDYLARHVTIKDILPLNEIKFRINRVIVLKDNIMKITCIEDGSNKLHGTKLIITIDCNRKKLDSLEVKLPDKLLTELDYKLEQCIWESILELSDGDVKLFSLGDNAIKKLGQVDKIIEGKDDIILIARTKNGDYNLNDKNSLIEFILASKKGLL